MLGRALAGALAVALLSVTVLAVAALLGLAAPRQSPWRLVAQVVVVSGAWLLGNGPLEGSVLWVPVPGHGLTVADLASLPPLALAAVLAVRAAVG